MKIYNGSTTSQTNFDQSQSLQSINKFNNHFKSIKSVLNKKNISVDGKSANYRRIVTKVACGELSEFEAILLIENTYKVNTNDKAKKKNKMTV